MDLENNIHLEGQSYTKYIHLLNDFGLRPVSFLGCRGQLCYCSNERPHHK